MKIGLLSDTHGHRARTRQAARLLREAGAERVYHCGDLGGEAVLEELSAELGLRDIPVRAVTGNMDFDFIPPGPSDFPGVRVVGRFFEEVLDGKRIGVLHGDDRRLLNAWLGSQRFDYCLVGHTHAAADGRSGRTRILNPGALFRVFEPTVALLDLATGECRWIPVPDDPPGR